jgi:hypothetical protein
MNGYPLYDYVNQYENETDENIRKHEKEKKKANAIDQLMYNADGNINFYGILLKSILFGSIFYSLQKTVNFLTDF